MKKLLLFLLLNSAQFVFIYAQLSGTKTVGDYGDYATLTDAVLDVNTNGLNGNTVFEIKDGYDKPEYVTIRSYSGNDQYTLTIRPEAGATEVILRSNSCVIQLASTNNIIIDGRPGGIITNYIALKVIDSSKGNSSAIYNQASKNTIIRYCYIRHDCTRGVSISESDSSIVENCDIATYTNGPTSNTATVGIDISRSTNTIARSNIIHDLHVDSVELIEGISLSSPYYKISTDSIYNNFIAINTNTVDSSVLIQGIKVQDNEGSKTHIYFNTIVIGGKSINGNFSSSYALNFDNISGEGIIKNNIFINKRSNGEGTQHHYCVSFFKSGTPTLISDYNLFLCDEIDGITGYNFGSFATLTNWQDGTGLDLHSVSKEVEFENIETGDLHLAGNSLTDTNLYGTYMANIKDIDNMRRWVDCTIMGADQPPYFFPCIPGTGTDQENILENGDFEDCNYIPWYVYCEIMQGVSANAEVKHGQFTLSEIIIADAPEYWQVQLMQVFTDAQIGKLNAGEDYILSFDAWSKSGSRPCHLSIGQSEFPYDDMLDQFITIDAVHRSYSYEFQLSTIYEHKMRLALDFGTDATAVTIDNVRLVKKATVSLPGINNTNEIKIMPNPATDHILVGVQEGSRVCLYNTLGVLIKEETIVNSEVRLDVTGLAKGNYLVEIRNGNTIRIDKVIVQ